jgi:hypothetical protein
LIVSFLLFIAALASPCYCTQSNCINGLGILLTGWSGFYMGGATLSWFANPLLFVAWRYIGKRPIVALAFSVPASIFAIYFLYFEQIYDQKSEWVCDIIYYKSGYWLWLLSIIVILLGSIVDWFIKYEKAIQPVVNKRIYITLTATIVVILTAICIGLNKPKQLDMYAPGGCYLKYQFAGNLDTLNQYYLNANRKLALCACKKYGRVKESQEEQFIREYYKQYGHHLNRYNEEIRIDTILKYKEAIFDTVEHQ